MSHNAELCRLIVDRIKQAPQRRISFAEFMDLALYHPQQGYYASKEAAIGPQGDFVTSPHLSHDFSELLAAQFVDLWQILGYPEPFTVVEMGAGQGLVAGDVLNFLEKRHPVCFAALQYWIVEKSAVLQAVQQQRLARWADKIQWTALEAIPANTVVGCFFSNELVDALPVHQVMLTEAGLYEVYVTLMGGSEDGLMETVAELSDLRLAAYFELVGIDLSLQRYPVGYRTEVNLAALSWMKSVAARLQRGFVLTIDYGYSASRYYGESRSQGTLQCYYRHAHHNDPYSNIGNQDITAHVDFTALERQGEKAGLMTVGYTQQALFLMALGLGERLNALSDIQESDPKTLHFAIQRREVLHQLINPMGLGNFGVLIQSKGLTEEEAQQPIKGLIVPPLF
ncbi:class I SAM-dependent methyltransferase [Pseudanabaena sp. FACHB-2040]|nr:class I SAM-dependent methyltransferase [Pseudanabaena sp. FACHB-2040]